MSHDLVEMLGFQRPAFSVYEEAFIDRYIVPTGAKTDNFGNLRLDVGDKPNVIWSSHTDTVHAQSGLQEVQVKKGVASIHPFSLKQKKSAPTCLGADCTTGVWMMLEMIEANVPGRYIFHRDEEAGGLGSEYIAKNRKHLFKGIDFAIAFDRAGKSEVITHQGVRTASDAFASSLSQQLGMNYRKSPYGMFTDTKNYRRLVPECTNISVGYEHAHSKSETQDIDFAKRLRDKICRIDTSKLVVARDHTAFEPEPKKFSFVKSDMTKYQKLVYNNPIAVAALMGAMAISEDELREWIKRYHEIPLDTPMN